MSQSLPDDVLLKAMERAEAEARKFLGATSPNPPVGAVALDARGEVLSALAHERAGTGHAEARVLAECEAKGTLSRIHTLVVTLEPCNHHGRTPPCSEGILRAGIRNVIFAERDPNPAASGGAERLRGAGLNVRQLRTAGCTDLLAPFSKRVRTGLPWVTVKQALDENGSMIPPAGRKTFTSVESLTLAHELRKRADAILTGSGTVLADAPLFTVRRVPDHPGKRRRLLVLDRRGRTPREWIRNREKEGFEVRVIAGEKSLEAALRELGTEGVLEVLVEAGPRVTAAVLKTPHWDLKVTIQVLGSGQPDQVTILKRD